MPTTQISSSATPSSCETFRKIGSNTTTSQLNKKESTFFVLNNNVLERPVWIDLVDFKEVAQDAKFQYLGRYSCPDGQLPSSAYAKLASSIHSCVQVTWRQTNVCSTATVLCSVGYAQVWHLCEGAMDLTKVRDKARTAIKTFFPDRRGRHFSSAIVHHPKHLQGIGLVEFVNNMDARVMSHLAHGICSGDLQLSKPLQAFFEWAIGQLVLGGISALIQGAVLHLPAGKDAYACYTAWTGGLLAQ